MEVRNCPRCGKIFVYVGRKYCPECREQDERDFDRVRKYLRRNPGSNIDKINEDTKVEKEKILQFLREGRLEQSPAGLTPLQKCEICGKEIKLGRICDQCLKQFRSRIKVNSKGQAEIEMYNYGRMYVREMWERKQRK
ncbi:MAG: MerR family transcriptional regulator [bacterium]